VLEITVHRATDLVNNDTFSKSDPYVKLRYKKVEFRSKTISNNLNPEWNFSCSFDILNEEEKYIHINVYDDDFGTDNIQGCYSLPLELALNQLTQEGQWFSLIGCESGMIFVSGKFTKIKMEDKSTEKPIEIDGESRTSTLEKAEKLVSDIVEKAEKVVTEVEAHLVSKETDEGKDKDFKIDPEKEMEDTEISLVQPEIEKETEKVKMVTETVLGDKKSEETDKKPETAPEVSEEKRENLDEPFNSEITKGSQEVIEKIVEKIDESLEEKNRSEETKTSIKTDISKTGTTDAFKEIEKESQEVVEKIEFSMNQAEEKKKSISDPDLSS